MNTNEAPKVTEESMLALIKKTTYTILPDRTTTICQLTLKNGYTVEGKSACVSFQNFRRDVGEEYAYKDALKNLWPMAGLLLAQKLYEEGEDFVSRLHAEHRQLKDRHGKLDAFLGSLQYQKLEQEDQVLLRMQHRAMSDYLDVLSQRVERHPDVYAA